MSSLSRRTLLRIAALSPLAALAGGKASPALAQGFMPPLPPRLGTVGLVAGQFARVSLFRHAQTGVPSDPSSVKIDIVGLDGSLLATTASTLAPERGIFFDYDLTAGLKKKSRLQFHADVEVPPGVPIGATLEIYDAKTGETAMPIDLDIVPDPTHALAMGMVGVAAKQIARLSLFHESDGNVAKSPTPFTIELLGMDGKLLAWTQGSLPQEQGAFFDFDLTAGLRKGSRVQFHADVRIPLTTVVGAMLEIYDSKTGETAMPINPCIMPDPSLGQ